MKRGGTSDEEADLAFDLIVVLHCVDDIFHDPSLNVLPLDII